jgi:hypothetical protein
MDASVEAKIEADQPFGRLPEDALKNRDNIKHSATYIRVLLQLENPLKGFTNSESLMYSKEKSRVCENL